MKPWKFIIRHFRWFGGIVGCGLETRPLFLGVEEIRGWKRKGGVWGGVLMLLQLLLNEEYLLVDNKEGVFSELNREELKFGNPQLQHIQEMLELAKASKTIEFMPKQFL